MKNVVLVITDGIGSKPASPYNAFDNANTPAYDQLFKTVPYSLVRTHGEAVGLPEGQMGNSEVGHMTIGSGRIIYQDLERISRAVTDGSIDANPVFRKLLEGPKNCHIVGLCSDGGVHSHIEHIRGIARKLKASGKTVWLHLITDGRDVSPTSGVDYVKQMEAITDDHIRIATVGGRFYTMDRDKRWDRVQKGYDALVSGANPSSLSPSEYLQSQYEKEVTDEFIVPASFGNFPGIQAGDSLLMANFRSDRVRQITQLLGDPDFMPIEVTKKPLNIVTMTEYSKEFSFPVLFNKEVPKNTLAETVSKAGGTQFHTAETEKYAHVTFFLNGGIEEPFENETRVLIPSPKVTTYDEQPEMSAPEVCDAVLKAMDGSYNLVVVNFANGDMVGHTGNYDAAVKAVETVDTCVGKIAAKCDEKGYAMVLTADHGNCEEMRDPDGNMLTNHTVGDVYCFVKAPGVTQVKAGGLSHIAPTVLKLMELPIPAEMDQPLI